ncbi:hypothetical protein KDA11_04980, partial [Candidatus Saccharibacteria bacterium]|nr:hypothetical protein [Candidatus Saccharibacteria bacterium]
QDDKERAIYYDAMAYVENPKKLRARYIGVFRLVSGLLDLWENYAIVYFNEVGELKYFTVQPTLRSMDGEYRSRIFNWGKIEPLLGHLKFIEEQMKVWVEKNEIEFQFEVFSGEENSVVKKIRKNMQNSRLGLDFLTMYAFFFYLASSGEVFYPFVHNFNTRLIADLINTDYTYPVLDTWQALNIVRSASFLGMCSMRKNYVVCMGQKIIPLIDIARVTNEVRIGMLVKKLKSKAVLTNVPSYLYSLEFSGINANLFMNESMKNKYALGEGTDKALIMYMYHIPCSMTVYFSFVNFNTLIERGFGNNLSVFTPNEYNYYILDWVFNLTSMHLNADIVHLDLHLNNICLGRSSLRIATAFFAREMVDAGIQFVIDDETTLYLPTIEMGGYILDFSRAVDMTDWEKAQARILQVLPEVAHLSEEEAKTMARFYDFEMLFTNLIEGMRSSLVGTKTTVFDKMPKKVRDKLLLIRKTLENLKRDYLDDDSTLPREFYPGRHLLKELFGEFRRPYKLKKIEHIVGLEMNAKDKIEYGKYRESIKRMNYSELI